MDTDYQHFQMWYKRILEKLYDDPHAGFPILMITFPLLERYLREKSQSYEEYKLNDKFHDELIKIFPELNTRENSKKFWKIYRNGILHQATLSGEDKTLSGCLTKLNDSIRIDTGGTIYIYPTNFSKKVIMTIENDFYTFTAAHSTNHMLAVVSNLGNGDHGTSGTGSSGINP